MSKAIGMIEFKTTSTGVTAADAMVKTSEVEIVEAQTVCPGKYIAIITGDLSAVKAAVDTAVTTYEDKCIDSFVLGNPHESIFPAIYGTTQVEEISALGILETYDAASIIEAADQAAKTAIVDLIELRIAKGMCGKSYMMITGENRGRTYISQICRRSSILLPGQTDQTGARYLSDTHQTL